MLTQLRTLIAVSAGLFALVTPVGTADADPAVVSTCGGEIFHDRDADGTRVETLDLDGERDDVEPGVAKVTVRIVDIDGRSHETRSLDNGSWSIDLEPSDYPIRIEFEPPDGFASGRAGPDGGTLVQFASSPEECDGAPVGNLGVFDIDEYCAEQPEIAVPCYVTGDDPDYADAPAIHVVTNLVTDNGDTDATGVEDWLRPPGRTIATLGQVGTIYGQAAHRDGTIFVSSFTKRHTRLVSTLNPQGNPTVIYRIPPDSPPEVFVVVDESASDPHGRIPGEDAGEIGDDLGSMSAVYTTGLGDLEISPDGSTLYTVDLGRRELVEIDVETATIEARTSLDAVTLVRDDCNASPDNRAGDLRAFGLGWDDETLLLGVVCSAETTVDQDRMIRQDVNPGRSAGDHSQLTAYVYGVDDGDLTEMLAWSLEADRGETYSNGLMSNDAAWHPWTDRYPYDDEHAVVSYPQPAVTDIAVDELGNLVIALGDRWGHQTAPNTIAPARGVATRTITEPITAGDIQRACPRGRGWVIEGTPGCDGGFGNGWEFFDGDSYGWHAETAFGSILRLPGRSEVVASHMDPKPGDDTWWSGGLVWHGTEQGEARKGVRLYDGRSADPDHTFEQATGLGDLAVLCGGPPVQVGGTVWYDRDADGVRDPGEVAVPGVALELRDHSGEVLSVDVTDERGAYWFDAGNVPDGLVDGARYDVTLAERNHDIGRGVLVGTGPFTGLVPTVADAGERDDLDSDARPAPAGVLHAGMPTISVTAGDDSATAEREPSVDHSRDLGLTDRYDLAITTTQGDRTSEDGLVAFHIEISNEGSIPSGEFSVRANLPAETSLRVTAPMRSVTTEIEPGTVTWLFPDFLSILPGTTREFEMVLQVNDPTVESITNTIEIVADSGDDDDSTPGETVGEDDEDQLTILLYDLAGSVWSDDSDGGSERTERGVADLKVYVLDEAGQRLGETFTDSSGRFLFDSFPAGTYTIAIPEAEFESGRPLHGFDRAVGAMTNDVSRMIDDDGAVRSRAIELGVDATSDQQATIELGLTREPPRPLLDVIVPAVLLPVALVFVVGLLVDRRRNLSGALQTLKS